MTAELTHLCDVELDVDAWQAEIIDSPHREKFVSGGRGTGKTLTARNALTKAGLEQINGEYAYFSPSYAVAKREWRAIAKHPLLRAYIEDTSEQPFPIIRWRTGTSTYFRSVDREETTLGYHLDGVVVDEVHKVGEATYDETIRPQTAAKRGWCLLIGQHDEDGEEGWLYKRFAVPYLTNPNNTRTRYWRIPSSMGRMYQGEEGAAELEAIRTSTSDFVWRWQYMAEPIESQNKAFRREDITACTSAEVKVQDRGVQGAVYAIGYDIGKVVDPSGEVVLQRIDKERAHVVYARKRPLGEKHEAQAIHLAQTARLYNNAVAVVDATGQTGAVATTSEQDAYARFYRQHCPTARGFFFNEKSKQRAIQDLQLAIEQQRILIPAVGCEDLIKQLSRYRWEMRRGGSLDFHGPDGHEDDLVIAITLAWQCVYRGWCGGGAGMVSAGALL